MNLDHIYIIPARKGSKEFPLKNRKLFDYTAVTLEELDSQSIIVTTDDEEIIVKAKEHGFRIHRRSEKNSDDYASLKEVVLEVIKDFGIKDKLIHLLYLTYPERKLKDIEKARIFLQKKNADSLLCRKLSKSHPYLCFESLPGDKAKPVLAHNFYRRQDYPECFEVSHFISIFKSSELNQLTDQLYNDNTIFFHIEDKIDVDHEQDFLSYVN